MPPPADHAEHQLFAAAEQGDLAKVKLLLAMGAQPSAISEGSHLTPLMMAAENGHEAVVLALLGRYIRFPPSFPKPAEGMVLIPGGVGCVQKGVPLGRRKTRTASRRGSMPWGIDRCCSCCLSGRCKQSSS